MWTRIDRCLFDGNENVYFWKRISADRAQSCWYWPKRSFFSLMNQSCYFHHSFRFHQLEQPTPTPAPPPPPLTTPPCRSHSPNLQLFYFSLLPRTHWRMLGDLHNLRFSFILGITAVPRDIENNAYAKSWRANKVYYGKCGSGVYLLLLLFFLHFRVAYNSGKQSRVQI